MLRSPSEQAAGEEQQHQPAPDLRGGCREVRSASRRTSSRRSSDSALASARGAPTAAARAESTRVESSRARAGDPATMIRSSSRTSECRLPAFAKATAVSPSSRHSASGGGQPDDQTNAMTAAARFSWTPSCQILHGCAVSVPQPDECGEIFGREPCHSRRRCRREAEVNHQADEGDAASRKQTTAAPGRSSARSRCGSPRARQARRSAPVHDPSAG